MSQKRSLADVAGNSAKRKRKDDQRPSTSQASSESPCSVEDLQLEVGAQDEVHRVKAGAIKKIHMTNFMCHSSLEVDFNSRVNFIVGSNGSGKSAIMMALVVGLGGKASATNRGSSLKEFIKKGKNSATVAITLHNTGIFKYKPEQFGNYITVIRTISNSSGQAGYKIKSENGETVSTKKEDLDRVITALNVQVDNPISVLNQDSSRTFLNSTDPHMKYELFMKATQLQKLMDLTLESVKEKRCAAEIIALRKESLKAAEKEVGDWEHKYKAIQSLDDLRDRDRELENELYWCTVITAEKSCKDIQNALTEHTDKLSRLQDTVNSESQIEQEKMQQLREYEGRLSEIQTKITAFETKRAEYKEEARRKREQYISKMKTFRSSSAKLNHVKGDMETLKQAIENFKSESDSNTARRLQIQQEKCRLQERLNDVQATLQTKTQDYRQLKANDDKLSNDRHSLHREKQDVVGRIEQKERKIQSLRNESHDSLSMFGTWVPRVAERIEEAFRQGRFKKKPRGPLGAYIKLRDASWAPAIESQLGSTLKTYCVDSGKDHRVLVEIFDSVLGKERKPTVITSNFKNTVYDVRQYRVQSQDYPSVLDMLIVSDPVVTNSLIDQQQVESVLLIPTSEQACDVMSDVRHVPKNCKRAITKDGDIFFPDPNYRTYAGDRNRRARYLQVSMQEAISDAEEDLKSLITQKEITEKQLLAVEQHYTQNKTELGAVVRMLENLKKESFNIQTKLTELRDAEEPEPSSISTLTSELAELTRTHNEKCEEIRQLEEECNQHKNEVDESEMKVKKVKDESREIQDAERPLLNEKERIRSELKEIISRKKYRQEKYDEISRKVSQIQNDLNKQQKIVNKATTDALKICERIETQRSREIVEKDLIDCRNYRATVEQQLGSKEEITKNHYETKKKYTEICSDIDLLDSCIKKLNAMIDSRRIINWGQIKLTGLRIQHMFQSMLHKRRYKGQIKISFQERLLEIEVTPDFKKGMSDTKCLSGGERSFATVAFIMALWETVEPPFYFMDEFDVFMDKVNRRIVMDMLLENANLKSNFQFAFFTPLDTSHIRAGPNLQIHRMESPRRIEGAQ